MHQRRTYSNLPIYDNYESITSEVLNNLLVKQQVSITQVELERLKKIPAPPGAGGPRPGGGVDRQNTDKTSIRISITSDSTNINPISRLTITKLDLIRSAIIPFFSSVT